MQAGLLDRIVELQTYTSTQDASGQPIETWTLLAKVYADVRPMPARERYSTAGADRKIGVWAATVIIRWIDGLTMRNRIIYDNKTWDVVGVREIGRHEWLELSVEVIQ
jgi:SPP1 family predicted phage head-tail adaptor